ncbi:hypothetical protein RCL1_001575 [Eukaryota sp. TZLM3-RCL]
MNVNGLCSRTSCVLANSRYATITEENGQCYLEMKTAERAHTPAKLWEKIPLPTKYTEALALIDENLMYWPDWMIRKCKQRFTKIVQYLIRLRKLHKNASTQLVGIKKKEERREKTRELKALSAAQLERTISKELLTKLKAGEYSEIYNFPQTQYETLLDEEEVSDKDSEMFNDGFIEDFEDYDSFEEFSGSDSEPEEPVEVAPPPVKVSRDIEDMAPKDVGSKRRKGPRDVSKRRPHVEIEYEVEDPQVAELNTI